MGDKAFLSKGPKQPVEMSGLVRVGTEDQDPLILAIETLDDLAGHGKPVAAAAWFQAIELNPRHGALEAIDRGEQTDPQIPGGIDGPPIDLDDAIPDP